MSAGTQRCLAVIACISVFVLSPWRVRAQGIDYLVDLNDAQSQTVRVRMTIPETADRDKITVRMPNWRPGRYIILDNAGAIRWIRAADPAGNDVEMRKVRKDAWVVEPDGAQSVVIEYEMYANERTLRTRHADDSHAFLSGSATFLYDPDRRGQEHRVRFDMPDGWRVGTGLPERVEGEFVAQTYDILVDSPLEVGEQQVIGFDVDGIPHEIVIWGHAEPDSEQLAADFSAIVREQSRIFGDIPYERYVFLVHCGPGWGGGTEHWNSTIMGASPEDFTDDIEYRGWLGLVSHEMFHTWNVKRLRPAAMVPYDYQHENLTTLFWVAEGTTSYYDDLTLARTELIDIEEYLGRVSRSIDGLRRTPGRELQSLNESSWDAWIKFNKRTADSPNSNISFYRKGALVNMILDLEIRRASGGVASLDDVMRDLYERHPLEEGGFTDADFRAACERASGTDLRGFWADYVEGTAPVPFGDYFADVGLEVVLEVVEGEPEVEAYMGVRALDADGLARVTGVLRDGPAYDAGIIVDDLLVAINGERVRAGDLDAMVGEMEPGELVEITLLRNDRLRVYSFEMGKRDAGSWRVTRLAEPSEAQRAAFEAWMRIPWQSEETTP